MLINRNISMYFWTQIFSKASQSSYLHTQMYSHKLKSTFSYSLHQNTLTYEQTYTNEQLHTHSWKCAYICVLSSLLTHVHIHTHTHTHCSMLPVTYSYIFPGIVYSQRTSYSYVYRWICSYLPWSSHINTHVEML